MSKTKTKAVVKNAKPKISSGAARVTSTEGAEIKGAVPGINYLMNVKEHLVSFLGLGTRFRCAETCKAWRFMSPGPRRTVPIHSTVDAKQFVDSTPAHEAIILQLGGYWQIPAPYSKRHAIPPDMWRRWETDDADRKKKMQFTEDTVKTLLGVRPHHRVIGLQIIKGNRSITAENLEELWFHLCPMLSCFYVSDQNEAQLREISSMLKKKPFKGAFGGVRESGNCWWFVEQLVNSNLELEGLSISWPSVDDMYYHGPKYPRVATLQKGPQLPFLTRLDVQVESNECRGPTNYEVIAEWLLPRIPNLEVLPQISMPFSGNLGRKHGDCELEFASALNKYCQRLKSITVNQSGNDECFKKLLEIPTLETILWLSYNNADVSGESVGDVRNLCMKHLHLGAVCKTAKQGLFNIVKSCPNLESFSIAYVKGVTASDAKAALALLPHLRFGKIAGDAAPLATVGDSKKVPEHIRRHL